jgi:hypothetical protein
VDRVVLFVLAWLAGLVAYVGALYVLHGEVVSPGSGDYAAVLFWSAAAFAVAYVAVYLPLQGFVARRVGGSRPLWPFLAAAIAAGVLPTALILLANGGDLRALAGPEARLFGAMFVAIGVVVGAGYTRLGPRAGAPDARRP